MSWIKILMPILVGALIGYGTNHIAIKMLFHPRKAVKLFGHTLPFTPGVIPKNQPRLARAVGAAVGDTLFTQEDLIRALEEEPVRTMILQKLTDTVFVRDCSLKELADKLSENGAEQLEQMLEEKITEKMVCGMEKFDYSALIMETAAPAILKKVQGTMLSMFVNESMISSFAAPIGEEIAAYVQQNGADMVQPLVQHNLAETMQKPAGDFLEETGITQEMAKKAAEKLYDKILADYLPALLEKINISKRVEQKICEMEVEELEKLTLSVMKHELQAVINLGAVIGAVIGSINVFF